MQPLSATSAAKVSLHASMFCHTSTLLTLQAVGDYSLFLTSWSQPSGGIHGYLARFLNSGDPTFQHIAIWTLLQLLESSDPKLIQTINQCKDVMDVVREISKREVESEGEGDGAESEDGEAEVVALARRCLEISSGGGQSDAGSRGGSYPPSYKT